VQHWGVRHDHITVGNSKANGQVERTIRTIKEVIRKGLTEDPESFWSDHLPAALIVLRHSMARGHGFPPFTIITGLLPVLPSNLTHRPVPAMPTGEVSEAEEAAYVDSMCRTIADVRKAAKLRLARNELRLQRQLLR